ncbi:MAG: Gfo/Idh/MocA family oxidoreductase [Trueperaceae bacterium]|nr:Gfo/Idh/MocA family oxidoreductase [Trueperaceae bacterium]
MRVGIVGAGSMGQAHAAGWVQTEATLVGFLSNEQTSAEVLARRYGARTFANYRALLDEVDVVDLCVPTDLHYELALQAAQAGKHAVCEKPLALSLGEAKAMIDVCHDAGVRLFVAHVLRFFPQYRSAADAVRAGHLGDLGVMRFKRVSYPPHAGQASWFADEERSGGMIFDLMIHDLDYARWLGGDVTRVFAKSVRSTHPGANGDYALVTLRFASGAMALVEGGWVYPPGVFRTGFDLAGTDGLIEWSSDDTEPVHRYLRGEAGSAAAVGLPLTVLPEDPYTTEIKHVYEALRDDTPFLVAPEDAFEALRLCVSARESLRRGRAVRPEEVA